jgi:excisionase family DNA binding protein
MAEEWTVKDAADHLGVTRARVDQFIRDGRLTVVRTVGPVRMLRKVDVLRLKRKPTGWQKGRPRKEE